MQRRRACWLACIGLVAVLAAGCSSLPGASTARSGAVTAVTALHPTAYTRAEVDSIDSGTPLGGPAAPGFTLIDQFGRPVSLSQFRGKVVVLSFDDDECTTICPLTGASMVHALALLGPAAADVQLLGVNANPDHVSVGDAATFSRLHGLENHWLFLTGPRSRLAHVWKAYGVYVQVVQGNIDHTPAVYVIDRSGRERRLFLTSTDYGVVPLEAYALAKTIAPLLPGHPRVARPTDAATGGVIGSPKDVVRLPALSPGGTPVALGGLRPRLVVFFASWAPAASREIQTLARYEEAATRDGLPGLTAVDVQPVEPALARARRIVLDAGGALQYPVAVDASGRVADAYGVQDIPWLVLVDRGKVLWSHDGWLAEPTLVKAVKTAMSEEPSRALGVGPARPAAGGGAGRARKN